MQLTYYGRINRDRLEHGSNSLYAQRQFFKKKCLSKKRRKAYVVRALAFPPLAGPPKQHQQRQIHNCTASPQCLLSQLRTSSKIFIFVKIMNIDE